MISIAIIMVGKHWNLKHVLGSKWHKVSTLL